MSVLQMVDYVLLIKLKEFIYTFSLIIFNPLNFVFSVFGSWYLCKPVKSLNIPEYFIKQLSPSLSEGVIYG